MPARVGSAVCGSPVAYVESEEKPDRREKKSVEASASCAAEGWRSLEAERARSLSPSLVEISGEREGPQSLDASMMPFC